MRGCTLSLVAFLIVIILSLFVIPNNQRPMGSLQHSGSGAPYDQLILFGDSLFQHSSSQDRGFTLAPALQAEFIRRLDIVNRGFSGYNTDQGLIVLPKIIPNPGHTHVRFLIILFGANDSCLKGVVGGQHVPLERFKRNLKSMVTHPAILRQKSKIVLVTPPPVNEHLAQENDRLKGIPDSRRRADHTKLYADAVKDAARELGIPCLDLWALFMSHAGWDGQTYPLPGSKEAPPNQFLRMLLHDGLHLTSIAYMLLFQELLRIIESTWPQQRADQLSYVFPAWNDRQAWKGLLPSVED